MENMKCKEKYKAVFEDFMCSVFAELLNLPSQILKICSHLIFLFQAIIMMVYFTKE